MLPPTKDVETRERSCMPRRAERPRSTSRDVQGTVTVMSAVGALAPAAFTARTRT
jgi:hypothetical protein